MLGLLSEALHCHFHLGPALVRRNLNALDVSAEAGELKCPVLCVYTLLCFGLISRQAQSKPVNERRNSSAYFIQSWKEKSTQHRRVRRPDVFTWACVLFCFHNVSATALAAPKHFSCPNRCFSPTC